MAHDVFISYSSKDKPVADATCAKLEGRGIRCWLAPRDISPGADWSVSIIDAINGAAVMVLVFSANANASQQIKREVERAVNKGIPVIPLRIENVAPEKSLEYFISTPHWLDAFSPPMERHLTYLGEVIAHILEGKAMTERPPPPPPPWWARARRLCGRAGPRRWYWGSSPGSPSCGRRQALPAAGQRPPWTSTNSPRKTRS